MLKDKVLVFFGADGTLGSACKKAAKNNGALCVSISHNVDIKDKHQVYSALYYIKNMYGKIDIVINAAGMTHTPYDFVEDDYAIIADNFSDVVDVNLNGAFYITAASGKIMIEQNYGHIIHFCSNGSRLSLYGSYGYNASKHGVEGIIKTAAAQLARFNVRVNGIAPGTVITELNKPLVLDKNGNLTLRAKSILAHTPTKKFATVEGVAETFLALCMPQRHLTGNVLFCDDGYNIEGHSWPEGNRKVYEDIYS